MIADIFPLLAANPAVTALVGTNPVRIFPFANAPQETEKPYVTYGTYNGIPQNYLDRVPDVDNLGTQINIWAESANDCLDLSIAIRDTLEPYGHMTSFQSLTRDPETQLFTAQLEFDFWKNR